MCAYVYVILINNPRRKDKRNGCHISSCVYVIQNPPDLHKLFVRLSQPKSFNIFRIFDEYERLHAFVSHAIYNIRVPVVLDIQLLAFESSLYIRYMAAYVVNSKYVLCMYICMFMYVCLCMYVFMYVFMYVCVYVCMCLCMYVD